jgi:predicted CXXCH cytochrome family protein
MIVFRKWSWILAGGICAMLLAAGCATETKHRWLTFFFDGVPDPNQTTAAAPGRIRGPAQSTNPSPIRVTAPAEPPLVVHAPFAERNCTACHASNFSQRLKDDIPNVCAGCHRAFLTKAAYSHAPIEDGQCTICHAAHQSKEKYLLVKSSRELCFDCHDPDVILAIRPCGQSDEPTCTACHDPHQENQRFLLRTRTGQPSPARLVTPPK